MPPSLNHPRVPVGVLATCSQTCVLVHSCMVLHSEPSPGHACVSDVCVCARACTVGGGCGYGGAWGSPKAGECSCTGAGVRGPTGVHVCVHTSKAACLHAGLGVCACVAPG